MHRVVVAVQPRPKVLACKVREVPAAMAAALRVSVAHKVQAAVRAVLVELAPLQSMAAMVELAIRIAVPRVSQVSRGR